jgi:hypothetical protein
MRHIKCQLRHGGFGEIEMTQMNRRIETTPRKRRAATKALRRLLLLLLLLLSRKHTVLLLKSLVPIVIRI